jgi:hypothetical protein
LKHPVVAVTPIRIGALALRSEKSGDPQGRRLQGRIYFGCSGERVARLSLKIRLALRSPAGANKNALFIGQIHYSLIYFNELVFICLPIPRMGNLVGRTVN